MIINKKRRFEEKQNLTIETDNIMRKIKDENEYILLEIVREKTEHRKKMDTVAQSVQALIIANDILISDKEMVAKKTPPCNQVIWFINYLFICFIFLGVGWLKWTVHCQDEGCPRVHQSGDERGDGEEEKRG